MSLLTAEKLTTFRELGIHPALVNALDAQGITNPFPSGAAVACTQSLLARPPALI